MDIQIGNDNVLLYLQIYNYYKDLIMEGKLQSGTKIPSIRRCAMQLDVSRTTVENAYMLLAADGYIISKAQSGFYVTDINSIKRSSEKSSTLKKEDRQTIKYDFISANVDKESFNFDLWRRYIKSALRQDERLLSYGEPQGEQELRDALARYISEKRNVVCSGENIIVGAGIQSLLHIICALLKEKHSISFPDSGFKQGIAVFSDHNWNVKFDNPDCDVIYYTPSHITKWGGAMPVNERLEFIKNAGEKGSIIIEDDYDNEFCYFNRPAPSLQSLTGGHNVIYIGTFSRLLLPSIRISFMVLPIDLMEMYRKVRKNYNQTASKTEQIALCQFIRDGHLASQTRKLRKLYNSKAKKLIEEIKRVFGDGAEVSQTESGLYVGVDFKRKIDNLEQKALQNGIALRCIPTNADTTAIMLSCTSVNVSEFGNAMELLKNAIVKSDKNV